MTPKHLLTAAMVMAVGGAVTVAGADSANAAQGDCQSKHVCVFSGASFTGKPVFSQYKIGHYNVSLSGRHRVLDNQTGDAVDYGCSGANGTGKFLWGNDNGGSWSDQSLTGTKSIVLAHGFPSGSNC